MNGQQTRSVELSHRAFAGLPASVDLENRTVPIVVTTETPVRTWIPNPNYQNDNDPICIEVDEVLLTAGLDYSRTPRMPLLDNHDTFSGIRAILGRVDNVRAEDGKIVADAVFTNQSKGLLQDIAEGFYGQISAGYCVDEYEITERDDDVPLAVAIKWKLHEASFVPIGADPNATVRSSAKQFPMPKFRNLSKRSDAAVTEPISNIQENKMELEKLVEDAVVALDAVVAAADEGATEEVVARAAKLRKLRAEMDGTADPEKKEDEALAALTTAEEQENANMEASARAFGLDGFVRGLRAFGAKPATIRSAVLAEVAKGRSAPSATVKPGEFAPIQAPVAKPEKSAFERARSIYEKMNKR